MSLDPRSSRPVAARYAPISPDAAGFVNSLHREEQELFSIVPGADASAPLRVSNQALWGFALHCIPCQEMLSLCRL